MTNEKLLHLYENLKGLETAKNDFVVSGKRLGYSDGKLIVLGDAVSKMVYAPTNTFAEQVCEKLLIPSRYYDRMKESSLALLDSNVNHWFMKSDKNFLVRTYDNERQKTARALLSERHHMIDNWLVLVETIKIIDELGLSNKIEITAASVTETQMYIEVTCPEITIKADELLRSYRHAIERGTGIISGFLIQNSEVGKGAYQIVPRAVVLACGNGLIRRNQQLRRVHLGSKLDEGFDTYKSKEVREANIKLIREQMKYAISTFLSETYLTDLIKYFNEISGKTIQAPVNKLMKVVADKYGWNEESADMLIARFITGGDLRRIGVYNAMTEVAQTFPPDEKYAAEYAAYEVITNFESFEKLAYAEIQKN